MRFASTFVAAVSTTFGPLVRAEKHCQPDPVFTFDPSTWGNDVWISSMALRPNGSILMTSPTNNPGGLFQLDPQDGSDPIPVVRNFPGVNATHDVISAGKDWFFVIGNSMSMNTTDGTWTVVPNSNKLFEVDYIAPHADGSPRVKQVMNVTDAVALTGLVRFKHDNLTLIASDAGTGKLYELSYQNRKARVVMEDDLLMRVPYQEAGEDIAQFRNETQHSNQTLPFRPAISKIDYYHRHRLGRTHRWLFYTNAAGRTFNRLALKVGDEIKPDEALNKGKSEVISTAGTYTDPDTQLPTYFNWDGFAMFPPVGDHLRYRAYLASPQSDELQMIDKHGREVGAFRGLSSPTAVHMGKHGKGREMLYVAGGGAKAKWMACKATRSEGCEGEWDQRAGEAVQIYAVDAGKKECWGKGDLAT